MHGVHLQPEAREQALGLMVATQQNVVVRQPERARQEYALASRQAERTRSRGATTYRPCSGQPSNAAKQDGESNLGRHSQSIEPSRPASPPSPSMPAGPNRRATYV